MGDLLIITRTLAIFGAGWLLRQWLIGAWAAGSVGGRAGMALLFVASLVQVFGLQSLFWEDGVVPWSGFVAILTVLLALLYTVVDYRRSVRDKLKDR